jgi:hypothetical protein
MQSWNFKNFVTSFFGVFVHTSSILFFFAVTHLKFFEVKPNLFQWFSLQSFEECPNRGQMFGRGVKGSSKTIGLNRVREPVWVGDVQSPPLQTRAFQALQESFRPVA